MQNIFSRRLSLVLLALSCSVFSPAAHTAPLDIKAAQALWSMRAALNVAALQCQFDPTLNVIDNYKHFLQDHSVLLKQVQTMMTNWKKGGFDHYTTELYNSFSSVNEQRPFCTMASQVGGEAVQMTDEDLPEMAMKNMPSIIAIFPPPPVQTATKIPSKSKRKSRRRA